MRCHTPAGPPLGNCSCLAYTETQWLFQYPMALHKSEELNPVISQFHIFFKTEPVSQLCPTKLTPRSPRSKFTLCCYFGLFLNLEDGSSTFSQNVIYNHLTTRCYAVMSDTKGNEGEKISTAVTQS
jgi:hypothetical protein